MISSSSLQQQLLDESVWRGGIRRHTALQPLHPEHHMQHPMHANVSLFNDPRCSFLQAPADLLVERAVDVNSTHGAPHYSHNLCSRGGGGSHIKHDRAHCGMSCVCHCDLSMPDTRETRRITSAAGKPLVM